MGTNHDFRYSYVGRGQNKAKTLKERISNFCEQVNNSLKQNN